MRKILNRETVAGRVYEHNLAVKVTGDTSKNPGTEYIGGTLDVATDEDCLNIVTINFTYVTATTKSGSANATYSALKKIIDSGKTVVLDGKDAATMVTVSTALALNDFYSSQSGEEKLISAKRNEGGFVTIINKLPESDDKRNHFEMDMLINGTRMVEADEEKNIPADYLVVKGAVFNFRNAILPVEFVVKNPGGIKYFESLEASTQNLVFTKVWGSINSETIVTRKEEESAFGEPVVKEYERSIKEWVITGAAAEPYEIGDAETGITLDEIKTAMADREVYLADVKKRQDEYQASKVAGNAASVAKNSAAAGGFDF